MSPMFQQPWFQIVTLVLALGMALQVTSQYLGRPVALALLALIAMAGLTAWSIKRRSNWIAKVYGWPISKQWIDMVCLIASQQPPLDPAGGHKKIALKDARDFQWAIGKMQERIIGHDYACERLLRRLERNVLLLRRGPAGGPQAPLGVFLLVGPPGVGKTHVGLSMGRLIYPTGGQAVIDLEEFTDDAQAVLTLFGSAGQEGRLLGAVKREPFHTIVIENVHAAGRRTLEHLQSIFATGRYPEPGTQTPISFGHCLFIVTARIHAQPKPGDDIRASLQTAVAGESALQPAFFAHVDEVALLQPLSDLDKARVLILLIQGECAKYRIRLDYIEPEILVDEIECFSDDVGFRLSLSRLGPRLVEPLAKASQQNMERLILTRRHFAPLGTIGRKSS